MRLDAKHVTGAKVADLWGSEPDLRAEIKMKLAEQLAIMMRTRDLIDYVVTTNPTTGDTIITASIEASSTGDEKRASIAKPAG